jgi:hypothetical protein
MRKAKLVVLRSRTFLSPTMDARRVYMGLTRKPVHRGQPEKTGAREAETGGTRTGDEDGEIQRGSEDSNV